MTAVTSIFLRLFLQRQEDEQLARRLHFSLAQVELSASAVAVCIAPHWQPITLVSRGRHDRQTAKSDKSLQTVVTGSVSGILPHLMAASAQVCALLQCKQQTVCGPSKPKKEEEMIRNKKELQTQITNRGSAAKQAIEKAVLLPQRKPKRRLLQYYFSL